MFYVYFIKGLFVFKFIYLCHVFLMDPNEEVFRTGSLYTQLLFAWVGRIT